MITFPLFPSVDIVLFATFTAVSNLSFPASSDTVAEWDLANSFTLFLLEADIDPPPTNTISLAFSLSTSANTLSIVLSFTNSIGPFPLAVKDAALNASGNFSPDTKYAFSDLENAFYLLLEVSYLVSPSILSATLTFIPGLFKYPVCLAE